MLKLWTGLVALILVIGAAGPAHAQITADRDGRPGVGIQCADASSGAQAWRCVILLPRFPNPVNGVYCRYIYRITGAFTVSETRISGFQEEIMVPVPVTVRTGDATLLVVSEWYRETDQTWHRTSRGDNCYYNSSVPFRLVEGEVGSLDDLADDTERLALIVIFLGSLTISTLVAGWLEGRL